MFEFGARILLAGATVFAAGTLGSFGFPLAVVVGVAVGLMALAAHALESRGLYEGAGAGLHGALEGFAIALLLVDAGRADALGFLALLPYAWAAVRHRAGWNPGAFAIAGLLIGADALVHRGDPSPALLFQAGGVLALGLVLGLRAEEAPVEATVVVDEDAELRGRFRALREAYGVLERRAETDTHAAALSRAVGFDAIAQVVRDATAAVGAVLYAPADDGWVPLGSAGNLAPEVREPCPNLRLLQERGAAPLFAAGRPVGAVWVPDEARDGLSALSEALAGRFAARAEVEAERRARRVAELRIALMESGDGPDAAARALAASIGADSLEFGIVGPFGATARGRTGAPCGLPEALRHETGPGLPGWSTAGAPLVWIAEARNDPRLDRTLTLRARTAALALVPLDGGNAYVWAAWHTAGIGRPASMAALRNAEPVLAQWLGGVERALRAA